MTVESVGTRTRNPIHILISKGYMKTVVRNPEVASLLRKFELDSQTIEAIQASSKEKSGLCSLETFLSPQRSK
ncbi:hypothetical protein CEXT_753361 [Caerostris extrusa]|uniref:Uncharacterized protein n=1 Tax=Caerostris extrusa TaxID=172846 RepID=A0AAV4QTS2_CAEEX|nr:hypothetical protein CEXT_753361 [Caerostris extrusa]